MAWSRRPCRAAPRYTRASAKHGRHAASCAHKVCTQPQPPMPDKAYSRPLDTSSGYWAADSAASLMVWATGLFLSVVSLPAIAQSGMPGDTPMGPIAIGKAGRHNPLEAFALIEDKTAKIGLTDILEPALQASFNPVAKGASATNYGLTGSAFWLRISLDTPMDSRANWLLEAAYLHWGSATGAC